MKKLITDSNMWFFASIMFFITWLFTETDGALYMIFACASFIFGIDAKKKDNWPPMIRRLIILLLIVSCLDADVQLVKGDEVVLLKKGVKFSINDDERKYKFESNESGMINDTLDIQIISSITIYGNKWKKGFIIGSSIVCIALIPTFWNWTGYDIEAIDDLLATSLVFGGGFGSIIGLVIGKEESYQISKQEWTFQLNPL